MIIGGTHIVILVRQSDFGFLDEKFLNKFEQSRFQSQNRTKSVYLNLFQVS